MECYFLGAPALAHIFGFWSTSFVYQLFDHQIHHCPFCQKIYEPIPHSQLAFVLPHARELASFVTLSPSASSASGLQAPALVTTIQASPFYYLNLSLPTTLGDNGNVFETARIPTLHSPYSPQLWSIQSPCAHRIIVVTRAGAWRQEAEEELVKSHCFSAYVYHLEHHSTILETIMLLRILVFCSTNPSIFLPCFWKNPVTNITQWLGRLR